MATSSIFASFKIDNAEDAQAFVDALEKSEKATENEVLSPTYSFLTDKDEIRALMSKRKRKQA